MLKEIVDETSRGKYDFMYLRIGKSAAAERVVAKVDSGYLQTSRTIASETNLSLPSLTCSRLISQVWAMHSSTSRM